MPQAVSRWASSPDQEIWDPNQTREYDERMVAEPVPKLQPASALQLYRPDVETYDRMVESGALEGLRIELLEGLLVEMSPISPDHDAVVTWLIELRSRRSPAHDPDPGDLDRPSTGVRAERQTAAVRSLCAPRPRESVRRGHVRRGPR